jgi:antitoxin (DNA-binding transcriptional repressor) of toxin-antitoxin stability system
MTRAQPNQTHRGNDSGEQTPPDTEGSPKITEQLVRSLLEPLFLVCHYPVMKQISIKELQSDAENWVKQASLERQIVITSEGLPVATIIPFPTAQKTRPLPNREDRITRRSLITTDSAIYISEMRD